MAVNTAPRFTGTADFQGSKTIVTANTTKDGTGGAPDLIYTAPADGGLVEGVVCMPLGTNTASVARLFLNNGLTLATASNNMMIGQISLPATTNSEVAALLALWIPIPRAMQDMVATHRLYVTIGTTVAAGWAFSASCQKFAAAP